jgi:alpha-L-fucosidase 2
VPNQLKLTDGKAINVASGQNTNVYYRNVEVADAVISPQAKIAETNIRQTFLYDVPTQAGKSYVFGIE